MAEANKIPRRVVSGMRPTGRLHLGHYHGAVKNWIEISRKAECFFFSADWHALTSDYKDTSGIALAQREMFADWIAAGLDPDRCKMSKSYGNSIELGEEQESARKKIMAAVTDPARKRRMDPGNPEICGIYYLHRAYSPPETVAMVDRECRTAGIGCVDCKKLLLGNLVPALEKHRAARAELDRNPARIDELVQLGTQKAAQGAEQTMVKVREAVKLA